MLAPGIALLTELGIPKVVTITSAHRTPDRMTQFAKGAADKGIKVIIAAAGGAAHLPGIVAACTHLPVLGTPVKASALDGVDSLYSQVQMAVGSASFSSYDAFADASVADSEVERMSLSHVWHKQFYQCSTIRGADTSP